MVRFRVRVRVRIWVRVRIRVRYDGITNYSVVPLPETKMGEI